MEATFLACSFAGIAYIPIDKNMPESRIKTIIEQTNPKIIIGDLKNEKTKNISSNEIEQIMAKKEYEEIMNIEMKKEDIYYIIFTSGSTGEPKGVEVTYENVNSCINWLETIVKIKNGVILNQAVFSFDLSVADIYLSLLTSSEHYILGEGLYELYDSLKNSNANVAVITPSFAELLLLDKRL